MSSLKGKEGVCRIEVSKVCWNEVQPWQRESQTKSTGSGFMIDGHRLLTNAHVVQSAVDIRVRPHGSTRRFPARIVHYAPDVDLAILKLAKTATQQEEYYFFHATTTTSATTSSSSSQVIAADCENQDITANNDNNNNDDDENDETDLVVPERKRCRRSSSTASSLALEFAHELPALQERVHVVGFPTGGQTICVTEGVVSRIDLSGNGSSLVIQVDSAINPGNSGGPAFNQHGQVTGMVYKKRSGITKNGGKGMDNIGYVIPTVIIQSFLKRCRHSETGTSSYELQPSIPYRWHSLENHSLRQAHQVPDIVHGVLITSSCHPQQETTTTNNNNNNRFLQKGDVLTHIDNVSVADDGQIILRGDELIQHAYLLLVAQGPVTFQIFRQGQYQTLPPYTLSYIPNMLPHYRDVDYHPEYVVLGALVLLPFTSALRKHRNCGIRLNAEGIDWAWRWPREWEEKQGLVVLAGIFSHELTHAYVRPWRRVLRYNGVKITSLGHLQNLWDASQQQLDDEDNSSSNNGGDGDKLFVCLELQHDDDIVFQVSAARQAQKEILEIHEIPKSFRLFPPGYTKYTGNL